MIRSRCFRPVVAAAAIVLSAGLPLSAATRYDPHLRFRTIRTAHFDIHAHQGEDLLAQRLAAIAESARSRFAPVFGVPRGRVQVILVDQTDLSNGWATPTPRDTIEITTVPPSSETLLGNTTDWLDVVFSHEYTHILHLDRTRGFMQGFRDLLGRNPGVFPNSYLPVWQIEGIATYEESRMTGEGRVPAGDFRAIVDVAAAHDRFDPIDRASGGLDDWPAGLAAYAYGAYFHQYLADRYGPERLVQLADATAGRLPLFGAGAFTHVYGRSERQLWADFRDSRSAAAAPHSETEAAARRLTHDGFSVAAPGIDDAGAVYYAVSNGDAYPALKRAREGHAPVTIATRLAGERTSVRGRWIVFDQLALDGPVALFSDLYAVRASGGPAIRLTRGARAADPDLSPDGARIACVVQKTGYRALALLEFTPEHPGVPAVRIDDPTADYTGPRWSPDGRSLLVERRRPGLYELVVVDLTSGDVRTVAASTTARLVTPSWSPDGTKIFFAANVGDAPFNVYALDPAAHTIARVTDTIGGAQAPEWRADGTLVYVGYTPDGSDLFAVQSDPSRWAPVSGQVISAGPIEPAAHPVPIAATVPVTSYRPWRTLLPTYWTPVAVSDAGQTFIGAGTTMSDALGRQSYGADVEWTNRTRPDWHASYAYDRWQPTLFANYADQTQPFASGLVRTQELFGGALLPFRHVRWTESLFGGVDADVETIACTTCRVLLPVHHFRSIRMGWLHDSRRLYPYSISVEEGFSAEAAIDASRRALGADANAQSAVGEVRVFHRVFSPHIVVAGRAAGAASWGDAAGLRAFGATGSGGLEPVFDFGRDTIGLVRGIAPGESQGARAAVGNLDLRFPVWRVERGVGSWPLFVRAVHSAVFTDAGHSWDGAGTAGLQWSCGAELLADVVVLHYTPFTVASGWAWVRDPVAGTRGAAVFARIGRAF